MFAPSLSDLAGFLAVSIPLNVAPGADMMLVAANTLNRGAGAGRRAAIGIALGSLIQAVLALTGISALLGTSAELMLVLTCAGAGYLAWLGARILRGPYLLSGAIGDHRADDQHPLVQGVITNLLNVKVIVFYVGFLPLFVNSYAGPAWQQMLLYGVLFNLMGTAALFAVAASLGRAMESRQRAEIARPWVTRAAGTILIAMAVSLLVREAA